MSKIREGIIYKIVLISIVLFASCHKNNQAFLYDDMEELKDIQKQLVILSQQDNPPETQFSIIQDITENLKRKNKSKILISFLTTHVEKQPNDVYNGYWLLMVANEYLTLNMPEIASYYLEKIITSFPEITVKGKSIHYLCLQNLVRNTKDPVKLVNYYTRMLNTLYDKINPGYVYFMLGQAYEKLGEWDSAIQTYSDFIHLNQFDVIIPGIPDSYNYARRIVDYAASSKNWTFDNLESLVSTIKKAIQQKDFSTLEKCKSKVNFFAMSWKQEQSDTTPPVNFNLRTMMRGGYIKIANELDNSSTRYEAYLKTVGWSQYTRIWYLYFKKINFPADPDIHGRWEWAGIYYGEKL